MKKDIRRTRNYRRLLLKGKGEVSFDFMVHNGKQVEGSSHRINNYKALVLLKDEEPIIASHDTSNKMTVIINKRNTELFLVVDGRVYRTDQKENVEPFNGIVIILWNGPYRDQSHMLIYNGFMENTQALLVTSDGKKQEDVWNIFMSLFRFYVKDELISFFDNSRNNVTIGNQDTLKIDDQDEGEDNNENE